MKLNLFLAAIFAGFSAYCQPDSTHDSLRNYSYLILSAAYRLDTVNGERIPGDFYFTGSGTGFLVRKDNRLFLGSTYHGLTNTDAYKDRPVDTRIKVDIFILRYIDVNRKLRFDTIDVKEVKDYGEQQYFLRNPDVHFVELKGRIIDSGMIFALNEAIYKKEKKLPKKANQRIISFGYPYWSQLRYGDSVFFSSPPKLYEGYIADSIHYDPALDSGNIDSMYLTTTPYSHGGTSGAPVFKIIRKRNRQWVEFVGVQSGKNLDFNCGYTVKKKEVIKKLESIK